MRRFSNNLLAVIVAVMVAACAGPVSTLTSGDISVGVRTEPNPAELGDNQFSFWVERDGAAIKAASVRWRMFMVGMPMNSDHTWIEATADGRRYTGIGDFSMGGDWQVVVQVTPASGDPVTVTFPYTIEWKLK